MSEKARRRELRRQSAIQLAQPGFDGDSGATGGHGRRLQTVETASKDDPRLKDLYEIEFEIKQSKSELNPISPIRAYLNLHRKSILRINPLNMTLIDEWEAIEYLDGETAKNNMPPVIFNLEPNSIMLITMDLRSLMKTEFNWVYGEDWSVSITIDKELSLMDRESP